jgi:hypothetical protein
VIALAVALSAAGVAIAGSETVVTEKTKDAFTESSSNINLSTSGGTPVTITSIQVPAGIWVVSGEATLVNFGPSDYFRCVIKENGVQIASGATMVGNMNLPGNQGPGTYVAGRGLIGGFKASGTSTSVELACQHDHNTPTGEGPGYVDAGAVLYLHKGATPAGIPTS